MTTRSVHTLRLTFGLLLGLASLPAVAAERKEDWIDLSAPQEFAAWESPREGWTVAGDATLPAGNERGLTPRPGKGVLVSPRGKGKDLISKRRFQDVEVSLESMIARNSNSGVKLNGLYEIQIRDTAGATKLTGDSCGGIYPRGEHEPKYHTIDEGVPPRVNAAKPAGQWQSLVIRFRSPRVDAAGKRIANAEFVSVTLNGKLIHEHAPLDHPTGAAWRKEREIATGPLLLQGDHGAVAFRKVRVSRLNTKRQP